MKAPDEESKLRRREEEGRRQSDCQVLNCVSERASVKMPDKIRQVEGLEGRGRAR
jgi:phage FluMu gp28-like protein